MTDEQLAFVRALMDRVTEAWHQLAPTRKYEGCIVLIPVPDLGYSNDDYAEMANALTECRLVNEAVYGNPMRKVMTKAERDMFGGYHAGFVFRCKAFDAVEAVNA